MIDVDVPPALAAFLAREFSDETTRLRALHAPWPEMRFRSAWDERDAWQVPGEQSRTIERAILEHKAWLDTDHPFFVAPGTGGTLRSPYPELSDGEYWLYVCHWGSERSARTALEKWPAVRLDNRPTLAYLRAERRPSLRGLLRRLLRAKQRDPRQIAWAAQADLVTAPYL